MYMDAVHRVDLQVGSNNASALHEKQTSNRDANWSNLILRFCCWEPLTNAEPASCTALGGSAYYWEGGLVL